MGNNVFVVPLVTFLSTVGAWMLADRIIRAPLEARVKARKYSELILCLVQFFIVLIAMVIATLGSRFPFMDNFRAFFDLATALGIALFAEFIGDFFDKIPEDDLRLSTNFFLLTFILSFLNLAYCIVLKPIRIKV
jgi:hypothetical protein